MREEKGVDLHLLSQFQPFFLRQPALRARRFVQIPACGSIRALNYDFERNAR